MFILSASSIRNIYHSKQNSARYYHKYFPPVQTEPGAHPASCTMGTGAFPGVKCGRGVLLTTHPLLVPRSWNSRAITLPTLGVTPGLQRDHFTYYHKYALVLKLSARFFVRSSKILNSVDKISIKNQISDILEFHPVGVELFHEDRQIT